MFSIFVQPPKASGYHLDLGAERIGIGRATGSDIRLPEDPSMSRHHAEIVREGERVRVRDLGSRNGTFVNGKVVPPEGTVLRLGDTVSIGETLVTLEERPVGPIEIRSDKPLLPESTGTLILHVDEVMGREQAPQASEPVDSRLLARFGRHLAMFEAVSHAGSLLGSGRPLQELLSSMLERIFELVSAERGAIVLMEGDRLVPMATRYRDPAASHETIQIASSMTELVTRDRAALLTLDAQVDPRFAERASIRMSGIRSAMCAPLLTSDQRVLGLLYVDTLVAETTFGRDDLMLLTTLAVITAMKVENQRLLQAYLEKERLERELDIAKEISEALLPRRPPEIDGWEVFGHNVPCRAIGGDYFDFVLEPAGRQLDLVIADVCGKGIPAALLMSALQASFRAYLPSSSGPSDLLGKLNEVLFRTTPANKYATVFCACIDLGSGRVRYTNAGHNAPAVLRAGGAEQSLATGGLICGMFEQAPYEEGTVVLDPGDLLMAYTDGCTDEESPAHEVIGAKTLSVWARELIEKPVSEIGRLMIERVDAWGGSEDRFDDRTLILLRRLPAAR